MRLFVMFISRLPKGVRVSDEAAGCVAHRERIASMFHQSRGEVWCLLMLPCASSR